ncbi:endonuclease/exonuclease/phosphatase family protein [Noviherbaspirillum saxi]|uniref:Endonuclease n=1 Tax=Noviherbaspirillum saxi TaxID=2320863 RepID=A0A3A3FTA0_9BURK|nr:endonuclease/exonuclease/phosphatase family protein [Noviherbaspirillum saxi]RJF99276.1 endonuclease [Noviherbaspirillum saxi]
MKLITWNIQWGRGADGRVDIDRIITHARRIADFDVLCLQEVSSGYAELPGNDERNQFEEIARRLPGFHAIAGKAVDASGPGGGRRSFGNMMLSRFAVGPVFRHLLPWPVDPGKKSMQRIALEASLQTPLGAVRITVTHLEYYSALQRCAQVERLRELHREAVAHAAMPDAGSTSDGPFFHPGRGKQAILLGDFNCRPDSEERRNLLADFDDGTPPYRDASTLLYPGQPHAPTVGLYDKVQWPGDPFTCDFVFISDDLAPRVRRIHVDDQSDASDHQPVLLEIGEE